MYNYVDQFNNGLKINKNHTKLINKLKKKKFYFLYQTYTQGKNQRYF